MPHRPLSNAGFNGSNPGWHFVVGLRVELVRKNSVRALVYDSYCSERPTTNKSMPRSVGIRYSPQPARALLVQDGRKRSSAFASLYS